MTFVALSVVALVLAHLLYRAIVRLRFPADGVWVRVDGARLHVRKRGSGPLVVLVHGSNGTSFDFPDALLADLARTHTVLSMDRPGHGHSERDIGPLDLTANARAVRAMVRSAGGGPAVLVGHSYGAAVALRASLDEPSLVRGVVAVTPATVLDPRNRRWARAGRVLPALVPLAWMLALPVGLVVAPRVRRAAWHPGVAPRGLRPSRAFALCPDQLAHAGENAASLARDLATLAHDLPGLGPPLVVLAGGEDRITPAERHRVPLDSVPDARIEVIPGAGHWLPETHAEQVVGAVHALAGAGAR